MKKVTPIILTNSLNVGRGGLTIAVFTRANTLVKKYKEVYIYTFLFQHNYQEIIEEIYDQGLLDRRVKISNLFEDKKLDNSSENNNEKLEFQLTDETELTEFKDLNNKHKAYRYYENGIYKMYKRFDKQGNLLFIDHMDEARHRNKRHEFNNKGQLVRIRHMDIILNKPRLDRYLDDAGNCYLTIWINPKNLNEGRALSFGEEPKEYKSIKNIQEAWVESKIKNIENPVLISDRRHIDQIIINVKHKNVKQVAVIHNNHLKAPYNNNIITKVKDNLKATFENVKSFDRIVFLTNEQKNDVENLFGKSNAFSVIPHSGKSIYEKYIENYDSNTAVTLARLTDQKALHEAIEAFKLVVDKIPKAKYLIYGSGEEKSNLTKLIKDLDLEKNVKLENYTTNPSKVYQSAACSILTSNYEGFGMVITESMSNGTPVVSYDTKYGPSDIIRDNIDGFIVNKGNREELAKSVIKIMRRKRLRKRLSKSAIKVNERFSNEDYINNWCNLLNEISNEK